VSTPLIAPTLQDLIQAIRDLLNQPDPNNSFWNDEELTRYLNEAIRIHMAELTDIDEGQFGATYTLNIVESQETVALPSDFFIARALYKVTNQENILLSYRNNLTESYPTDGEGTSEMYAPSYYFRGNNIVLRPLPRFSEAGGLLLEYVQLPASLQDGADQMTAQIVALFRQSVEMYGVYKAKLKESLANNIRVHDVAMENFKDLFKQFRDLSAKRSKNPTYVLPFNPEN
jgi:hypothetical protein